MAVEVVEIFPWNENFATGIQVIDEQHRKLIRLLNKLVSHLAYQADAPSLNEVFEELRDYTEVHFTTEMAIWRAHFEGDSWEKWHDHAHGQFIDEVLRIKATEDVRPLDDVIEEIVRFLTHWLAYHILEADKRMAKVVLALPSGMSLAKAEEMANEEMAGSTRMLIDTVMTMYDQLANRTVALTREINRRKRVEDELVEARMHADAANAAKSTFLASMSHEIRTPLNTIAGLVYLMRRECPDTAQQARLDRIGQASELLLGIVNGVLDLSRIEAGRFQLRRVPLSIGSVLDGVASMLFERAAEKGLQLEIVREPLPDRLLGDSIGLQQMLLNLANNAIKFTEEGRVSLRACVAEETDLHVLLRFEVRDSGIGIAPEQLPRLFQPFQQLGSATRTAGGTGLGLAIVRRMALQMGGEAGVESTPGEGSLFWFSARLHKPYDTDTPPPPVFQDVPVAAFAALRGRRVLVADDDDVNQEVARLLLEEVGLEVHCVNDGASAVEAVATGAFDLVLMDVQMPVLDGVEATRRIRRLGRTLPIVALTASAFDNDRRQCEEAGMSGFLIKPVVPESFYSVTLEALS